MTRVDNVENESSKSSEIVLSLLGILLKNASQDDVQWLGQSINVDNSEALEPVDTKILIG